MTESDQLAQRATLGRGAQTLMPGGGVSKRPLHLIVMADCSGSMKGEKMQSLNFALRSMLPHLMKWERDQLQAQMFVQILGFASEPSWHVPEPLPLADLSQNWRDLEYVKGGMTNMSPAFRAVSEALGPARLPTKALSPAILLVTDGLPTDEDRFDAGLAELTSSPAGRASLRVAVAIGRDASSKYLDRFRSPEVPVRVAENVDDIVDQLVAASIVVSRMSEVGADRRALGPLISDFDDEEIL